MRRSAVTEGIEQEAELSLCLLGSEAKSPEHERLRFRVVYTYRAPSYLRSVNYQVIRVGTHPQGITLHIADILRLRRGKRVMLRVKALRLIIPLQQRKIDHPQGSID